MGKPRGVFFSPKKSSLPPFQQKVQAPTITPGHVPGGGPRPSRRRRVGAVHESPSQHMGAPVRPWEPRQNVGAQIDALGAPVRSGEHRSARGSPSLHLRARDNTWEPRSHRGSSRQLMGALIRLLAQGPLKIIILPNVCLSGSPGQTLETRLWDATTENSGQYKPGAQSTALSRRLRARPEVGSGVHPYQGIHTP
jgi:hypothetical protein